MTCVLRGIAPLPMLYNNDGSDILGSYWAQVQIDVTAEGISISLQLIVKKKGAKFRIKKNIH